ncbi:Homeodomain-like protein, partial [Haematococcus lacustris]
MGRARPSSDESSSDDESFKPRRAGVRKASRVNQQKGSSRPWSKGEEESLLKLVQAQLNPTSSYSDDQNVDWGAISARLGGRTAKQAREKFRNDLRPDISKGPWSAQEEYVLALAHSQLGNKWNAIAKYLPRRAENTIKNH